MQNFSVQINKEEDSSSNFRVMFKDGNRNKVQTIGTVSEVARFVRNRAGRELTTLSIVSNVGNTPYSRGLACLIRNAVEASAAERASAKIDIYIEEDMAQSSSDPDSKSAPLLYLTMVIDGERIFDAKTVDGDSVDENAWLAEHVNIIAAAIENTQDDVVYDVTIHAIKGSDSNYAGTLADLVEADLKKDYGLIVRKVSVVSNKLSNKEPVAEPSRLIRNSVTGNTGVIFNIDVRDIPEDGVSNVMLFPYVGELKDSECTQLLDRDAAEQLAKTYNGQEFLVDQEHWSYSKDGSTMALGWCKGIIPGDDGCYATIKWTPTGRKMINGGEYRYVSGVWYLDKDNRPRLIESVGLTNKPRIRGSKPIPIEKVA